MSLLDGVLEKLAALPPEAKEEVVQMALDATAHMRFVPLPGPQTDAYLSSADILLYGGQAGGGKSYLLMGLASQEHRSSIIFRRESSQTDGLEKAGKEIIGDSARFNGTDLEWSWSDGRGLKLAGMKEPGDWNKHAGRERDLFGFDEAGEFLLVQVSSLIAWLRAEEGQRCRVVLASNPPRSADGYWMTEWFAPWLDPNHPKKAEPGELRWAVLVEGMPVWVDGPEPIDVRGEGELEDPMSFTFIPAALADNPYRNTPKYRARLNSLPEPLRSQLLRGDFSAGKIDSVDQAIPSEWVKAAQRRWEPRPPVGVPQCAIGVDVAQGGADNSVLAPRHDGWFAPLEVIPGAETPGGPDVAAKVIAKRRDRSKIIVDLGGGWGGDALAHLVANDVDAIGYMGVKTTMKRTEDNQLQFYNVRTEAYWRFREALNPNQKGGSPIALPLADKELEADLTAPTFQTVRMKRGMGIKLESKEALVKRIGRSPDRGDAVVMSWWAGPKAATDLKQWEEQGNMRRGGTGGRVPKVVMGRTSKRRR
jgi:hypothetical protein